SSTGLRTGRSPSIAPTRSSTSSPSSSTRPSSRTWTRRATSRLAPSFVLLLRPLEPLLVGIVLRAAQEYDRERDRDHHRNEDRDRNDDLRPRRPAVREHHVTRARPVRTTSLRPANASS